MKWLRWTFALGSLLAATPGVEADDPCEVVVYYPARVVREYQPVVYTYRVPAVEVTTYRPAVVTYRAPYVTRTIPVTTYYPSEMTYRTGFGVFRPRYTTYIYP